MSGGVKLEDLDHESLVAYARELEHQLDVLQAKFDRAVSCR